MLCDGMCDAGRVRDTGEGRKVSIRACMCIVTGVGGEGVVLACLCG
jgi:hypothetical protein